MKFKATLLDHPKAARIRKTLVESLRKAKAAVVVEDTKDGVSLRATGPDIPFSGKFNPVSIDTVRKSFKPWFESVYCCYYGGCSTRLGVRRVEADPEPWERGGLCMSHAMLEAEHHGHYSETEQCWRARATWKGCMR